MTVAPARTTEVSVEASYLPAPPAARLTELTVEAVVYAPPNRQGNASVALKAVLTRNGIAWTRVTAGHEAERNGHAYVRLAYAVAGGGLPIPDPTMAPVVTVVPGAGTYAAGTYRVGFTWIDPWRLL